MSIESCQHRTLEGISSKMQRDERRMPYTEMENVTLARLLSYLDKRYYCRRLSEFYCRAGCEEIHKSGFVRGVKFFYKTEFRDTFQPKVGNDWEYKALPK
jgi:hypothetical protein